MTAETVDLQKVAHFNAAVTKLGLQPGAMANLKDGQRALVRGFDPSSQKVITDIMVSGKATATNFPVEVDHFRVR